MTHKKLKEIIDHLWKHREYLYHSHTFDYPFYGGLKSKMRSASPEAVDAMQLIWGEFTNGDYISKVEFKSHYIEALKELGEVIK